MRRVFLALDLPEDIRAQLAVQQFLLPLPRKVDPALFHLTLVFLGETPDSVLEAVHDALCHLRCTDVQVALRDLGLFGGARPRSVHVQVAEDPGLIALQARVETACRRAGGDPEHRRFVPHVTLGRFAAPPPEQAMRLERAVAETRFGPLSFPAREMVMYQSHLSGKTPWYEPLARYPFST